jgi:N-acetylneuraminate synthase
MSVKVIAEIGINHNGDMEMAKSMITLAKIAGCDFAKIQKRNPDVCVPEEQKNKERITPWGKMTYLEYKKRLEFSEEQIVELLEYSNKQGITFFASVWDKDSVDLMAKYTKIAKIPSALINDIELCIYARKHFEFLIISTGMSTEEEIVKCVECCTPNVIMHTNSTYPCPVEDLNLRYIEHLRKKYPQAQIGYSGHEFGLVSTFAAQAMGATWIERHITLDRMMWGSDQLSSVEPSGLFKLVKGIRDLEKSMQYEPQDRILFEKEFEKMKSLRKVNEPKEKQF